MWGLTSQPYVIEINFGAKFARTRFLPLRAQVGNSLFLLMPPRFSRLLKSAILTPESLRYQCTPKLTILSNFSFWYSQVHLIEFFQLQKVQRKKVSFRQCYNEKTILWINYIYLEAYKYKRQGELYSVYHKAITDVNTTFLNFAFKTSLAIFKFMKVQLR